jgi:S-methylmethionine-dependent homocysteine/selenocysteine methylase
MKEIESNPKIHQYMHHPPRGTSALNSGVSKVFIGAYANKLTSVDPNWTMATSTEAQPMRDDLPPGEYWKFVKDWHGADGVQLIGGCCGIGPTHISCLKENLILSDKEY